MNMKKVKNIIALLTVVLLTITCKKEHVPTTTTSAPVFYFNGIVNGTTTSIDAGINNYYMHSSYTQDTNHVYNFIGNLQKTTSNLSSIEIQLNDYKVSPVNSSTQPDSSFATGSIYSYYSVGVTDTVYNVQFNSTYVNGTPQTYTWTFCDGTTSNNANPLHSYAAIGNYNVCLTITGTTGTSSICNNLNLSSASAMAQKVTISSFSVGSTLYYTATTTSITPYKYVWNFGDGSYTTDTTTATTYSVSHTYTNTAIYDVFLTVKDSSGSDTVSTRYNASTSASVGVTNFTFGNISKVINIGSPYKLSNVIIKWTDASGNVYTSNNNMAQPSGSFFKILSEESYQNNTNGQLTRKLHVSFTCTLYNGTSSIQIANADAVIAVAYK